VVQWSNRVAALKLFHLLARDPDNATQLMQPSPRTISQRRTVLPVTPK
jgi:hypothetical protein